MLYPAHEGFFAPARDRSQLWRLGVGVVLAFVVWQLGASVIILATGYANGGMATLQEMQLVVAQGTHASQYTLAAEILYGLTPTFALFHLAGFVSLWLGVWATARLLHRRSLLSLMGSLPQGLRDFGTALLVAAPILAVSFVIPPRVATDPGLDLNIWITFLPMSLAMVLVQTGAEEVFFRGYIQQQLAARFRAPLVWMVLPSIAFGLLHVATYGHLGANVWAIVIYISAIGIMAADLTARTGSIGAAWGFHFINNALTLLLVTMDGPLSGLALFLIPDSSLPDGLFRLIVLRDAAIIAAIWLILRRVLRR
ncbi:MAG: CPBP family intramembrane glutamic endopeptidase [Pseudomonadota bacterium]